MGIDEIGGVLVDSVREAFETSVFISPEEGPAEVIEDPRLFGELISTIHISGGMSGIVAMTSPWKVGEALTRNMLGSDEDAVDSGEVTDCAGEIVNIVAGRLKSRLAMEGINFSLSMPMVAAGNNVTLTCRDYPRGVRVPFLVDGDEVIFAFLCKKQSGPASKEKEKSPMRNILIVDDSSTMRKIISRSLRFAGFDIGEIVEADNGLAGLAALASSTVDLILTDINMPVMDGLTLISNVRKDTAWETIPIVVITTEGTVAMTREAIKRGANNLIVKPFTPEQIKEKLSPYLA